MLINSIYLASEGEGILIGTPQVFVRFSGCNIRCENCDSSYTWSFTRGQEMDVEHAFSEIVKAGHNGKVKRVSITGGNPLDDKNIGSVLELTKKLKSENYFVNLEAAGDKVSHELFDLLDFVSIDYKTPSSGVKMPIEVTKEMFKHYKGRFQVKSIVEIKKDFDHALDGYNQIKAEFPEENIPWVLTPSYNTNESFPMQRFQNVLEWNQQAGGPFRVIGQQHKWIFGPKKTNV